MYLIQLCIIVMMILGLGGCFIAMCKDLGDKNTFYAFMDLMIGIAIIVIGIWLIHEVHAC